MERYPEKVSNVTQVLTRKSFSLITGRCDSLKELEEVTIKGGKEKQKDVQDIRPIMSRTCLRDQKNFKRRVMGG